MTAIAKIRAKLASYPALAIEESPGWIAVRPPGELSFEVGLRECDGGFTVHFDAWHEEIVLEEAALELFAMGLSTSVRLKVTSRGTFDHCWTVERRDGDEWRPGSTTGLIFFPFWRSKKVRYLQNTVTESGEKSGARHRDTTDETRWLT